MPPRDSLPTESHSWQLSIAGRLCGPVDEAELRRMAALGQLSRFSLARRAGTPEWRPLAAVPELTEILPGLPVNPSFFFRVWPNPAELLGTLLVLLLVGSFWASRAGWFAGPGQEINPLRRAALAAQATAALRARHWDEGLEAGRQYLALANDPAAIQAQKQAWATLTLDRLEPERSRSAPQNLALLKTCLDWGPTGNQRVAERGLVFARDSLSTSSFRWADAEAYFDFALKLGLEETPTSVTQIAWAALSPRLKDLPDLGQEGFDRLFGRCVVDDLPESVTEHPAWILATALKIQEPGNWAQACPLFKQVAESALDPAMAKVAQTILARPAPGRREYARPPIIFRTPAGRPALQIELLAAEVTTATIVIELRVYNRAVRRQKLGYPVALDNSTRINPLLLIDDHGQAVPALQGFGEVGQWLPEQNLRVLELARGERLQLHAWFPPIDPGATRVRFVSPRLQNQAEWGWKDLPLQAGPFERPLRVLPLQLASLPPPQPTASAEVKAVNDPAMTQNLSPPPNSASAVRPSPAPVKVTQNSPADLELRRRKKLADQQAKKEAQERAEREARINQEREARLQAEREAQLRAAKEAQARKAAEQQQAYQAGQQASAAREKSRRSLSLNPNKRSLFGKADDRLKAAKAAYDRGDYAKATEDFQRASENFQKADQIKVDDGIRIMKELIRIR